MTTPDTAAVPPERCLICDATMNAKSTHRQSTVTSFDCGLVFRQFSNGNPSQWIGHCSNATAAALRCGATLEPTPREVARDDLVAAIRDLLAYRNRNALNFQLEKADDYLARCAAALAVLEPHHPYPPTHQENP